MLIELSIVDLVKGIKSRKISAESLMEEVYTRIDKHNSQLNVFLSLLPSQSALARASKIDQKISSGQKVGKLAGIPVSIKERSLGISFIPKLLVQVFPLVRHTLVLPRH